MPRRGRRITRVLAGGAVGLALLAVALVAGFQWLTSTDPFEGDYVERCGSCHGERLEGSALGPPLIGGALKHGDSVGELSASIAQGFPQSGMPAWSDTLSAAEIQSLAIYVAERRVDRRFTDFRVDAPLHVPEGIVSSELHDFRVETVATGLEPWPFSLAALPDGRLLVTEKHRGLGLVSADGTLQRIEGTPRTLGVGLEIMSSSTASAGCSTWRSTPTTRTTAGSTCTTPTSARTAAIASPTRSYRAR